MPRRVEDVQPTGGAPAPAPKGAEKDLLEAIARLEQGRPKNAELKARARAGKLKVNPTTAAIEAGCARRLAYKYDRVRKALGIDEEEAEATLEGAIPIQHKGLQQVVVDLRQDKRDLQRKLRLAESQNAALVIRLRNMEQEVAKEVRKAQRQAKRGHKNPNQVAGSILRLVPTDDE